MEPAENRVKRGSFGSFREDAAGGVLSADLKRDNDLAPGTPFAFSRLGHVITPYSRSL
jgi:hypothetical protein